MPHDLIHIRCAHNLETGRFRGVHSYLAARWQLGRAGGMPRSRSMWKTPCLSRAVSALLLAGTWGQVHDCTSLGAAIRSYDAAAAGNPEEKSITTFTALLTELGMTDEIISKLQKPTVLVPTDSAFIALAKLWGGDDVDALAWVKGNAHSFRQILLFHFTDSVDTTAQGVQEVGTGLEAINELTDWINPDAICGRTDSQYIKLEYDVEAETNSIFFSERVGGHVEASSAEVVCRGDVHVMTVNQVLLPCPLRNMFTFGHGCMTVAHAAMQLEGHPFGKLPYLFDDGSTLDRLKHPNALTSVGAGYTVFFPTVASIEAAGVNDPKIETSEPVMDHILRAHIIQGRVCTSDKLSAEDRPTLASNACGERPVLTLTTIDSVLNIEYSNQGSRTVAYTNTSANGVVCGGLVHVINEVFLPCSVEQYRQVADAVVSPGQSERVSAAVRVPAAAFVLLSLVAVMTVSL